MDSCIILVGIKHAGKTTVGKFIARQQNLPFFDIDRIIETQTGKSCRNLYKDDGVDAFKQAEIQACRFFTESPEYSEGVNAVIATGGGICDNTIALEILKKIGVIIYLNIPKHIAFARIMKSAKREKSLPAYLQKDTIQTEDDMKNAFYELYKKRSDIYRAVSDIIIDIENLSPKEIWQKIGTSDYRKTDSFAKK